MCSEVKHRFEYTKHNLCSEIQLCFMLTIICSEVKHRYEYTRTSKVLDVRPQGCQARENRCRQLLQLVVVERQRAVEKQEEKIISTRKQDNKHHCQG